MNFENKVVFVTGAAGGIGKAVAGVFAGYGATVIAADIDEAGAKRTADSFIAKGLKSMAVRVDVSDRESVQKGVDAAVAAFGTIHILANCAGIAIQTMLEDITEAEYDRLYAINTRGVFYCCRAVLPLLKKNGGGKIVTISSNNSRLGEVANGVYCSTKSAVSMLTLCMGLEWAKYNINVNAIGPGIVNTEMLDKAIVRFSNMMGGSPEEYRKQWTESIPMKRLCRPEEIGELAAFLASDKSDYISGVTINIDGGTMFL